MSDTGDGGNPSSGEFDGDGDDDIEAIRTSLIEWYEDDHREFPWRQTTDPYEVLVSEVMSQQTQLNRVVDAWHSFLDHWPTVDALASTDRATVVEFWTQHRLGYNNRAKYLHEAARTITDEFGGTFPETPEELRQLPGVGPYTANAVASFAFNNGNAVVDTNVKRVLYRMIDHVADGDDATFEHVANEFMPDGESRVWNNAIMELGSVVCQKTPRCDEEPCPWRAWCHAYATGDFTAPDVPTQPSFDGSRRQFRGRIVRVLGTYDELAIDELGPRIRVDYTPDGEYGREWLRDLLTDLADDGLIEVDERDDRTIVRLRR